VDNLRAAFREETWGTGQPEPYYPNLYLGIIGFFSQKEGIGMTMDLDRCKVSIYVLDPTLQQWYGFMPHGYSFDQQTATEVSTLLSSMTGINRYRTTKSAPFGG
jgi:hypothetical protein